MNPLGPPGQQRPQAHPVAATTPTVELDLTYRVVFVLNDDTWKSVIHRFAHADITKLEAGNTP